MTGADPSDAAEYDRLHYRGREPRVLINQLGIRDLAELEMTERAFSEERADQGYPADADFRSYAGFKAIHRHLFQDVYDWAGRERTYLTRRNPQKPFVHPGEITGIMDGQFGTLAERDFLKGGNSDDFAHGAAVALREINRAHPFIEGNGRVMRTWLRMTALHAGYEIILTAGDRKRWNDASRAAFTGGSILLMKQFIARRTFPITQAANAIPAPEEEKDDPRAALRLIRRLLESAEIGPGRKDGELHASWTSESAEQERERTTLVARHREDAKAIAIEIWSHRDPRAYEAWERGGRKALPARVTGKRDRGEIPER